jgi:hypothetical protein
MQFFRAFLKKSERHSFQFDKMKAFNISSCRQGSKFRFSGEQLFLPFINRAGEGK